MAAYIVTAPLVIARSQDDTDLYLYRGAAVPSNLKAGELGRLRDGEFIAELVVLPTPEELAAQQAAAQKAAADKAEADRLAAEKAASEAAAKKPVK